MKLRIWVLVLASLSAMMLSVSPAAAATVGPPTGLSATSGNHQVSLAWTAPSVGGNPAISDYIIEYSSDNGITWSQVLHNQSVATSITITSLTNNVQYAFRVSALNADGVGAVSAVAVSIPVSNHSPNDLAVFSACPAGVPPATGFTDTESADVDCIKYYGITNGTTATTYSPLDTVTRWQMALFLTRMATVSGITLGSGADQGFADIVNKSAEIQSAINQIKQLGITVGKTATMFAPDDNVTREEMALFISRFLKNATTGPGGNEEYVTGSSGSKEIKSLDVDHNFTDLTGLALYESSAAIASLWNLGVTDVQSATLYQPLTDMSRASMAVFMANALDHTNARPAGLLLQASAYRVSGAPSITFSITNRTAGFQPISGTPVDTFQYTHSLDTSVVRFDSAGNCSTTVVVLTGDTSKCQVTSADRTTDLNGNVADIVHWPAALATVDIWAWTAAASTLYDNDVHSADASKITIETTA